MIRATDSSVGMLDHTILCLRMNSSELLTSHNLISWRNCWKECTQNLKPLQQQPYNLQQQRNLHHLALSSILNHKRPFPVSLLHARGFHSSTDYAKLGLPDNASKAEVKSAYFSLAKKLHPDNGGNAKEFNEITEAYKRLSSDGGYPPGQGQCNQSQHGGYNQDLQWMEEMERRRRARMWMEQKMMDEEWARVRAEQKQWRNYHQAGRGPGDPENERLRHMVSLLILITGTMLSLQMLFFSITPSGCSQYEQGCTCTKCLEHERYMRQLGGPRYSRTGHQRGCECKVCVATGFQYLQHPPNCKCQTCRTNF